MRHRLALACLLLPGIAHAELCRFAGDTSHGGHLEVRAETAAADGLLQVDVVVEFTIRAFMTDYRYLGQEISTWRGEALQSVAVNQRYLADGAIKRQQWDLFTRDGARLDASRLQAKYVDDFRQRYPRFLPHWAPASFGAPWVTDFRGAGAERRPDLDLPAAGAHPPLAFAFYWSRFLPAAGERAAMVLPSRKRDKAVPLEIGPAVAGDGWSRWSTPLRHPALDASPASLAAAWVSPNHYLLQLGVELHTAWASGEALLRAQGCQGVQLAPG